MTAQQPVLREHGNACDIFILVPTVFSRARASWRASSGGSVSRGHGTAPVAVGKRGPIVVGRQPGLGLLSTTPVNGLL